MQSEELTFVCMSDTHSKNIDLPKGDVLIHAGDFSNVGERTDILNFIEWLNRQPFEHKVIVAGNHEIGLDVQNYHNLRKYYRQHLLQFDPQELKNELQANCHYLENSSVVIEGYKIWGSPYSLKIGRWGFQLAEKDSEEFWKQIEEDSEIIVTHGPPLNHGDKEYHPKELQRGDKALLQRVLQIKPIYHIFGHQHDGYGITEEGGVKFINPSILNDYYEIAHEPIVFKLKRKQLKKV